MAPKWLGNPPPKLPARRVDVRAARAAEMHDDSMRAQFGDKRLGRFLRRRLVADPVQTEAGGFAGQPVV